MEQEKRIYVTKEGYQQYLDALKDYKNAYAELLKTRVDYGKNSTENYQTGVFDMEAASLIYNIENMNKTIAQLEIITDENAEEQTVNMGDVVNVQVIGADDIRKVKIIGGVPDILKDNDVVSITINSPMGNAIYKKKIGDVVTYKVRDNEFTAMIISKEKMLEKQAPESQPMSE